MMSLPDKVDPETELRWCKQDLRIAEQNYEAAQARLDAANEEWLECRERLAKAEAAIPPPR